MASKKVKKNVLKDMLIQEGKDNLKKINEIAEEMGDELLLADGLEAAIVGVTAGSIEPVVVYDHDKCIEIFFVVEGMSEEDAMDHMSYNVTGSYVGSKTPIFIRFI